MKLELVGNNKLLMSIVEKMLIDIDGVTNNSLNNNENRATPITFYLGYIDNDPVCVIETYSEDANELFLVNFGLSENIQKQGKGKRFIAMFERLAKSKGCNIISLTSKPDAYGFCLACGYYDSGSCEYGLYKKL